jgi:serine/threonine-protein kinase
MLTSLFAALKGRFGPLPPLESLEKLTDDPLVIEGLRRSYATFAAGVREVQAKRGELGVPANPSIKDIGGYPIRRELGRGGMGAVYLAENPQGQPVVIKVPFTEYGTAPQYVELFFREFQALAAVRHENIVRVFRYGRDEHHGVYYYVAELVDGVTLKDYLEARPDRGFTPSEAATVSLCVLRAIRFLRSRQVTHRDLKPGNIMFDQDGWVKLIDFGSAKIAGESSELTNAGVMMGTFDYLPPEAGRKGEKAVGAERDLYALGIIHYRMLRGHLPTDFGSGQDAAVAFARFADARGRPLKDLRGIDRLSRHLLLRLTQREPEKRLVDFDEIEARLAQIIKHDAAPVAASST